MASSACVIAVFVLLCCCPCSSHGLFSLPGRRYRSFLQGEEINALVSPMTTPAHMLPADYYSLPFCKPRQQSGAVPRYLGEMLAPDATQSSPYRFRINVNESLYLCTTDPLTPRDMDLLFTLKFQHYLVHMLLDGLPLSSLDLDYTFRPIRGYFFSLMKVYPVDMVHVLNHLKFRVLLHAYDSGGVGREKVIKANTFATRYEIVGFEVVPCSVARGSEQTADMLQLNMYDNVDPPDCRWDLDAFMLAEREERITFTYQVEYVVSSNISWSSRWDPYYLKVDGHHFSVLGTLITILISVALFFLIKFLRSATRKLAAFYGAPQTSEARGLLQSDGEGTPPVWKLIAGDVFRAPNFPKFLCVAVATGMEIIVVVSVCIALAALGFLYPAPRGTLLTWILLLYALSGPIGGYLGVWLWGSITGNYEGWRLVCYPTAAFFPGFSLSITGLLNLVYWGKGSSTAGTTFIPHLCLLLALWACVLLPLTCCGGFLATKRKPMPPPVEISMVPRKIPSRQVRSWVFIFVVGFLPFNCIVVELFLVFQSIRREMYHDSPTILLAATLLWAVACCLTSVLITRNHIYAGDWTWWWKSFLASGFTGVYVFLYAIKYLVINLKGFVIELPASLTIYLGFSILAAVAVTLAAGAIGFLASFCFLRYFYASSKF